MTVPFSLYELFWLFSVYAVLGWGLEVCFCTINTGHFVNRGFLNGPVCPIYGFGMVLVVLVLTPVSGSVLALFFGGMVLTSAIELIGGWALKKLFHTSWWDYSDQPFNLGGYICLKFSLAWGLCVVAVMRVLQPLVSTFIGFVTGIGGGIPGFILAALIFIAFVCDLAVTVNAVSKMNRDLGAIDDVARLLHEGSEAISERLGTAALAVDENVDEKKLDAAARMDLMRAELLDHKNAVANRLMRAFPNMKSVGHADAWEQVKDWLAEKANPDKKTK